MYLVKRNPLWPVYIIIIQYDDIRGRHPQKYILSVYKINAEPIRLLLLYGVGQMRV